MSGAADPAQPVLVTPDILQRLGWRSPEMWAPILDHEFRVNDISTTARRAGFLAQAKVESAAGMRLVEVLDYEPIRLGQMFGGRVTKEALAACRTATHPADQRTIANIVYGGDWGKRNLGNTLPNDGWDWRGRGLLQVTGRRNYNNLATLLGTTMNDLAAAMETPKGAAATAAMWWRLAGCNGMADTGDQEACRKIINPGGAAMAQVLAEFKAALAAIRQV